MIKVKRKIKENKILTKEQISFLESFIRSDLKKIFRLSGGTALSAFYLEHRYSYDLVFFSEEKIPFYIILNFLKNINFIENIKHSKIFDRNIFLLDFKNGSKLNVEFVWYPLKNLEKHQIVNGLMIDSFLDIMINKLCAISDRNEAKDYVDFYFSLKKSKISLGDAFSFAEKKCEVSGISDILKYKLLKVPKGFEDIVLIKKIEKSQMENFFEKEIKKILVKDINEV